MTANNLYLQLIAASATAIDQSQNQTSPQSDPYVPVYVDCPSNLTVRNASDGLSDQEQSWREARSAQVINYLGEYLNSANITGLDVQNFTRQLNSTNLPITGLSISGGGTQSGLGGLGICQAYDSRYPEAVAAGTGGLTQILYYITGLSGGGAVAVSELAANDFSTVDAVRQSVNFSQPYDVGPSGNSTEFFQRAYELVGGKAEAGFPVSVADTFGRFWANWVPENSSFANYSDFARNGSINSSAFAVRDAPMPIIVLAENDTQCVEGFDKLSLIQSTTTNPYIAYFIDEFYDTLIFAKRHLYRRQMSSTSNDISIPQNETEDPLVQLVNETASLFDITFNQSLYGTYPNPFENYGNNMSDVSDLLLERRIETKQGFLLMVVKVDGSLTGETNPIRPLIVPERTLDFIIIYEASSDATYNWVNGTNLINTANSAVEGNLSFPEIPDVNTLITQTLTKVPTFFGCNNTDNNPLVLYLPNSPWTSYTNYSYTKASFTENQVDLTLENAFQLATYGNGTIDPEWPACLACATMRGSMMRLGLDMPAQCRGCYDRHCWSGANSAINATAMDMDPTPRLNSSLTFMEWNDTIWNVGNESLTQSQEDVGDEEEDGSSSPTASTMALFVTVFTFILTI